MAFLSQPINIRRQASANAIQVLSPIEEAHSLSSEGYLADDDIDAALGGHAISSPSWPFETDMMTSPDDWYGWLHIDGAEQHSSSSSSRTSASTFTSANTSYFDLPMAQGPSCVPPRVATPPVSCMPPARFPAATLRPARAPRAGRNPVRVAYRDNMRRTLRENPLSETAPGRQLLALCGRPWHLLKNGMAALQFTGDDKPWKANDTANIINWLDCGAYAHRSAVLNLIAVVNFERLNDKIMQAGGQRIVPTPQPSSWPEVHGDTTARANRGIYFLGSKFVSKHHNPEV